MKWIPLSILAAGLLIGGAILFTPGGSAPKDVPAGSNVVTEAEKQIVTITAKGGYQPRRSVAKAGVPTIVRFDTNGTFDCSSAVRIPSLNISRNLPFTGTTDIDIGSQPAGLLRGSCGMGMYPFEIAFQN